MKKKHANYSREESCPSSNAEILENFKKMPIKDVIHCPKCNKTLRSLHGLRMHLGYKHKEGNRNPFLNNASTLTPKKNIEKMDIEKTSETTNVENTIESKVLTSPLLKMFDKIREKNARVCF